MDFEENTVETQETADAADDAQFDAVEEEQDSSESLETVMDEEEADAQPEESGDEDQQETQGTSEPGWMRKRIDKAVSKAVAETEMRLKAQYEKQFAPILEKMMDQEARDLVRQGEFKSLERAKEYLKLKQGIAPEPAQSEEKPEKARDEKGRFVSAEDAAIDMKSNILARQANKIKENRGLDVMAEFNNNEETRNKILSGEWDFYDVADDLEKRRSKRPRAPAPMRTPNGASGAEKSSIASMSAEQFARLEKRIQEGTRYKI